ncbi:MAG TPA: YceD family protein [Polyangiaceae bacterium]
MTKPSFVVPLSDLERGPRSIVFSLDEAWLRKTLAEAQATPIGAGTASVELSKSGRDVMVRGRAEARVSVACVVTLDPIEIELRPEIFLLLAPREPNESSGRRAPKRRGEAGPKGKKGRAEEDSDSELSAEDVAEDTFEGSQIELDSFFREFLLLELPLFPRRSDLPSPEGPAIAPPSAGPTESPVIDPRLKPLADLKRRISLKQDKSKE